MLRWIKLIVFLSLFLFYIYAYVSIFLFIYIFLDLCGSRMEYYKLLNQRLAKATFVHLISAFISITAPSRIVVTLENEMDPSSKLLDEDTTKKILRLQNNLINNKSLDFLTHALHPLDTTNRKPSNSEILISNHQINTDWLYIWYIFDKIGTSGDFIVVLKNEVRKVPLIGYGIKILDFIFLKRKWAHDKEDFLYGIRKLISKYPKIFLIFPEGTTICDETREICNTYMKRSELGLPKHIVLPKHVLLPKYRGTYEMIQALGSEFKGMYNLTIGYTPMDLSKYPDDIYPITGIFDFVGYPKTIHVHIEYIEASQIPYQTEEAFQNWLMNKFFEKEKQFEHLISHGQFKNKTLLYQGPLQTSYLALSWIIMIMGSLGSMIFLWFVSLYMMSMWTTFINYCK